MTTATASTTTPIEARFSSPGQLTIATAAVTDHGLDAVLHESGLVVFDLTRTERVAAAGVQRLSAAACRARDPGVEVRGEDPNHRFAEANAALGMTSAFACDQGGEPSGSAPSQSGEE